MIKRIAAVLATLAMAFGLVAAVVSPASAEVSAAAFETDYAVDADWSDSLSTDCAWDDRGAWYIDGDACIQPNGDDIWVRDQNRDGYGVAVWWSDSASGREGMCIDALGVDKAWVRCNKDWTDGHTISWSFMYDTANGWQYEAETFKTKI
ncbi:MULTISPECIES: hypothetical protein [Glycomyces]|uniref:Secreted protein n=2 Tax=Glycomyces TaxID=58113 RepID=A0A9X3PGZ6_9ACTN|nr:hypothetical protein [Glycomyces lechevalierae]MDA1383750.1 hypothetical protein [Glycomyces lechevalierae]MDR7341259.1 hypothetical protein [Glycomyces lechevalierae]